VRNFKLHPAKAKSRFAQLPRVFCRVLVAVLPAVLLVTFLTVHFSRHASPNRSPISNAHLTVSMQLPIELSSSTLSTRPIFPYSVVPGGVRDAQELQKAAAADPIVAAHYADFRIAKSRTIQLDRPVAMYVSYRRNNRVFWTKNRMMIPAGETLISDGENLARVRCGNRLSPVAVKPVAVTDPDNEELETAEFVPPLMAGLLPGEGGEFFFGGPGGLPAQGPGTNTNPSTPSTPVLPPFFVPGVPPITGTFAVSPPPPPVNTPEPDSLSLFFAGAAFFALLAILPLRRNGSF
jgi:hypothetical protein